MRVCVAAGFSFSLLTLRLLGSWCRNVEAVEGWLEGDPSTSASRCQELAEDDGLESAMAQKKWGRKNSRMEGSEWASSRILGPSVINFHVCFCLFPKNNTKQVNLLFARQTEGLTGGSALRVARSWPLGLFLARQITRRRLTIQAEWCGKRAKIFWRRSILFFQWRNFGVSVQLLLLVPK